MDQLKKDFADEHKIAIACIYCNYKERDAQTVINLLASIWRQLAQHRDTLSEDVRNLYENHLRSSKPLDIHEVTRTLHSEITEFSKVFLLVDALDECPEDNGCRENLLKELQALQPTVNIMFTTRFRELVYSRFEKPMMLEIVATDDDLHKYIEGRISSQRKLLKHVQRDVTLSKAIVESVIGNAKGM